MPAGVNNKVNFDPSRYRFNDLGYSKNEIRLAQRPGLFLNFLENPSADDHGVTISCARTTDTATCFDANGILRTVSANTVRFNYDPTTGACLGLMSEQGCTNLILHSRDLSQSAWSGGSNTTAALTQTGIDDTANSATLLTATATNGTRFQPVTSASAARVWTAYVKRVTGTGTISLTLDGGSTYTDVTSLVRHGTWVRVKATQTLANPSVGFRLGTSGDAIAVDYCQLENRTFESSPVLSGGGQGVRQPESISIVIATPWFSQSTGTFYADGLASNGLPSGENQYIVAADDTTANERHIVFRAVTSAAPTAFTSDGAVTQVTLNTGTWTSDSVAKMVYAYAANNCAASFNGEAIQTDTSATMPTVTSLKLGVSHANSSHWGGHIRRIGIWPDRLSNAFCVSLAT